MSEKCTIFIGFCSLILVSRFLFAIPNIKILTITVDLIDLGTDQRLSRPKNKNVTIIQKSKYELIVCVHIVIYFFNTGLLFNLKLIAKANACSSAQQINCF